MLVCYLLAFRGCCLFPVGASAAAALLTLTQLLCGAIDECSHMNRSDSFDCHPLVSQKEAPPAREKSTICYSEGSILMSYA